MPDARLERTRRKYWIVDVVTHGDPPTEQAGVYLDEASAQKQADVWRAAYPQGTVTLFRPSEPIDA